jgi:hypothetical protein
LHISFKPGFDVWAEAGGVPETQEGFISWPAFLKRPFLEAIVRLHFSGDEDVFCAKLLGHAPLIRMETENLMRSSRLYSGKAQGTTCLLILK